ncbi:MAG: uracil-DNA glycosylase [Treponema sp.]|jgi:DNA polymerase|nr:uracil-DNA glycosylase [Treponema sp.]
MTIEQKTRIAEFLDLASAYLCSGYKSQTMTHQFTDDESAVPVVAEQAAPQAPLLESQPKAIAQPDEPHVTAGNAISISNNVVAGNGESSSNDEAGIGTLEAIAADIATCAACPLHATRTNAVPGEGVSAPLVLVIGEGPGENEDKSGRPFVGEAGQLLDKMLASIDLSREKNCFIANVVKCRPPHNRDPFPEEIAACAPFLTRQIALLKPRVILCAGRVATQAMVKTTNSIKNLHGHFIECAKIPLFPMYHPSALLHDSSLKRPTWDDLKTLRIRLEKLAAFKI